MKIALVCPDDISIVLFCKGIVEELKKSNNEIFILCDLSEDNPDGYYSDIIQSWDVNLLRVNFYRFISPVRDIKYSYNLYKLFKKFKFDTVINITTKPNIYGTIAAKLSGVKNKACAVWGMGSVFGDNITFKDLVLKKILLSLYKISFNIADKIWFTNQYDYQFFLENKIVLDSKTILTKNYLNIDEYCPNCVAEENIEKLRNEFGLTDTDSVIVMVARMAWAKGVKEFSEAAEIMSSKMPFVKFILVGPVDKGSPESVPKSYLKIKGLNENFRWVGFRRDVKELYALADIAVLPSYYREGGYPRGITEPMAMGKPVITTTSIHCCNTVEDGKNGYLIPIKDSKSLANAIEKILMDKKKKISFGTNSREKAVREYNETEIVSTVMNYITQ